MTLQDRISEELVAAMKAQDKARMSTLRMVKAALKNQQIESGALDDAQAVQVLVKLCKQRKESIEIFEKNARNDLAETEKQELAIIESYLPAEVSPDEIEAAVAEIVTQLGATSVKQMGQVMGAVMSRFKGRPIDGKLVSQSVKSRLS